VQAGAPDSNELNYILMNVNFEWDITKKVNKLKETTKKPALVII